MISGLLLGMLTVFCLAFLTITLVKSYNNKEISDGSRSVRTVVVGVGYVVQFGVLVYLCTGAKAYQWFRSAPIPRSVDTVFVVGIVLGIFFGAGALQWIVYRKNKR